MQDLSVYGLGSRSWGFGLWVWVWVWVWVLFAPPQILSPFEVGRQQRTLQTSRFTLQTSDFRPGWEGSLQTVNIESASDFRPGSACGAHGVAEARPLLRRTATRSGYAAV